MKAIMPEPSAVPEENPPTLPSWVEMNDGFEHTDHMGRQVRLRFSRFHGLMVTTSATFLDGTTHEATAYVGDPRPVIDYLSERASDA